MVTMLATINSSKSWDTWANLPDLYGTDYWPKVKEVVPNMVREFEKNKELIK